MKEQQKTRALFYISYGVAKIFLYGLALILYFLVFNLKKRKSLTLIIEVFTKK